MINHDWGSLNYRPNNKGIPKRKSLNWGWFITGFTFTTLLRLLGQSYVYWILKWVNYGMYYNNYLVGGFKHFFFIFHFICGIILPIDELIFFKMATKPPTSYRPKSYFGFSLEKWLPSLAGDALVFLLRNPHVKQRRIIDQWVKLGTVTLPENIHITHQYEGFLKLGHQIIQIKQY